MSFAMVAVSTQVIGAVGGALSAGNNARAQARQLAFEADMAEVNAKVAENAAQQTRAAGRREVQRSQLQTAAIKGKQRASMAANGIALDEGSALALQNATDYIGQVDANTIEANAIAAAWGHRIEATNVRNDGARARAAAGAINPTGAAVTSLIGSAGQVAASWYAMGKTGAGSTGPSGAQAAASGVAGSGVTGGMGLRPSKLTGFWGS